MPAPENVYVVAKPFKPDASGELQFGDRYDRERHPSLTDMVHFGLTNQRFVKPLTRETYANTIAHRPHGTIGKGFKIDELLAWGIIDAAQAKVVVEVRAEGAVKLKGYWVVPFRKGPRTLLEVQDNRGQPMRPKRFAKLATASAFIDTLPPVDDTPADAQEAADDSDVQRGTDRAA